MLFKKKKKYKSEPKEKISVIKFYNKRRNVDLIKLLANILLENELIFFKTLFLLKMRKKYESKGKKNEISVIKLCRKRCS